MRTNWKGPLTGMRMRQRREKPAYVSWWKLTLKVPFVCSLVLRHREWKVWKSVHILSWQLWSQSWWESELWGVCWWFNVLSALGAVLWGCSQRCHIRGDPGLLDCSGRKEPSVTTFTGHVAKRCSLMGCCQTCSSREGNTFCQDWKLKSDQQGSTGIRKDHTAQRRRLWSRRNRLFVSEYVRSKKMEGREICLAGKKTKQNKKKPFLFSKINFSVPFPQKVWSQKHKSLW